jgi:Flp pilus assembly CpaE family ATPase
VVKKILIIEDNPTAIRPPDIINRVGRLPAQKLSGRAKIVAFISSSDDLGTTAILSDVAAAIAALDKMVTLVDVAPGQRSGKSRVEAASPGTNRVILETEPSNNEEIPSVCEVLPSGIKVLHVDGDSKSKDGVATGNIELLHKMGDVADYLLVGLPFKPTLFARSILSSCDLIIVASSCKLDNFYETKNVIKMLLFLGITTEKIAAVLVDPEGILPSESLAGIGPYLEAHLGIKLAGVVSFDARVHPLPYLKSQPIIQFDSGSQLALDIKQIAQYITSHSRQKRETGQPETRVPSLDKG